MDPQLPLAIAILLGCLLAGWYLMRAGRASPGLVAILLVAVAALQVLRLLAGF